MSHTFESLTAMNPADLEAVLAAGVAPSLASIVGHEFRGWNVFGDVVARVVGSVMGIQRFAKGWFIRDDGDVDAAPFIEGYNVKVRRGEKTDAWTALPDDDHPTRHGFFRVFRAGEGEGGPDAIRRPCCWITPWVFPAPGCWGAVASRTSSCRLTSTVRISCWARPT